MSGPSIRRRRGTTVVLVLWLLVCVAALTWPGLASVAPRAPLRWLGLPFAMVWTVAWLIAAAGGTALYHLWGGRR